MSHQASSVMVTEDQEDTNKLNKSKSKRVKTLFKKVRELQDATGCKVFLYVKDQYNHIKFGGSPELSERFKRGQALLEGSKKKEVNFEITQPRPTSATHLKSMWPGTTVDEVSSGAEIADTFSEEGINIQGDSVLDEASSGAEITDTFSEEGINIGGDSVLDEASSGAEITETFSEEGISIEGDTVLDDTEHTSVDEDMNEREDSSKESIQDKAEVQSKGDMGEQERLCQKEGSTASDCIRQKENEDADEDDEPLSILKKVANGEVEEEISQDDTVYTVAHVRRKRELEGRVEYLVKWKGWAEKYNTWEPENHILDKQLIVDFNSRNKKQKK